MTRNQLLYKICPTDTTFDCWADNKSCDCYDCECVLSEWLDEYDKHVIEQYKADTNLKDTIKDIHDNVAQEMYCKAIDDCIKILKFHRHSWNGIEWSIRDIEELKRRVKYEV